jgi:uncharacterized membrane protein (DUF2068 family)
MDSQTAENIVRIIAVIGFIEAVLDLIVGVILLLGGTLLTKSFPELEKSTLFFINGNLFMIIGIAVLAFALLTFIIALGLWHRQNWARVLAVIFAIIGFFSGFVTLPKGVIGIAINGGIFYFLAINRDISYVFKKY